MIHYIYKVVNVITGQCYIGYTNNPQRRFAVHINFMKNGKSGPLYDSMRTYSIDNFSFEVIYCSLEFWHTLTVMEPYFIEQFDSTKTGYNRTKGGQGSLGWTPSEQTRELWSRQRTGRRHSKEFKDALSSRMKKNPPMHNPLIRNKVSETHKRLGIKPTLTPEVIEKIRSANTGKAKHSKEWKEILRQRLKQTPIMNTQEAKDKQKRNRKGKGIGERNGRALFCNVFSPNGELVASGHLKSLCVEFGWPFTSFIANSRVDSPMQRGAYKGWNVVKIPRPN